MVYNYLVIFVIVILRRRDRIFFLIFIYKDTVLN